MTFTSQLLHEWKLLLSDKWTKALAFWLPAVLFFIIWSIFSAGIARDLPVGIVDLDQSRISRGLVRNYDMSPSLEVKQQYLSIEQGSNALRGGDIYALVIMPTDLERKTLLGQSPDVTVFYNTQFVLIGKLIKSAIMQAQGTYAASIDTIKNLSDGAPVPLQAMGLAMPITSQVTPLFNSNNHYGQFLVSAAIPAIWQILIVATTVISMAAESRRQGVRQWLNNGTVRTAIMAKLAPYTVIFWMQGWGFLLGIYYLLGWPMHGSWLILLLAQLLMIIACQSMGALFYLLTMNETRAMSLVAGFTAPAFAFMGITFPATDMPTLAQWWRSMLPVSHYIEVQVQQVNYGSPLLTALPNLVTLLCFTFALFIASVRAKRVAHCKPRNGEQA